MLTVQGLNQYYGGSHILRDLAFEAPAGKVTVLLGRNGVGKTTLLKSLMGLVPVRSGAITFDGQDITHAAPYERARAGLGYVPQGRDIFARLTVAENLDMGLATRPRGARAGGEAAPFTGAPGRPAFRSGRKEPREGAGPQIPQQRKRHQPRASCVPLHPHASWREHGDRRVFRPAAARGMRACRVCGAARAGAHGAGAGGLEHKFRIGSGQCVRAGLFRLDRACAGAPAFADWNRLDWYRSEPVAE